MTFAAPTPELLRLVDAWPRPAWTPGGPTARLLPPPPRGAVPSPGPDSWLPLDPPPGADVIVGREVADAFELIWPTGETDEQFLGGPLPEIPPLGGAGAHAAATVTVDDDVVRAIQHAIATIGSDPVVFDQPVLAPRLPDRATVSATASGVMAVNGSVGDRHTTGSPTESTDARRSPLKRLIGGLRRR